MTRDTLATADGEWLPLRPAQARSLADARLQTHHAAQLVAAFGISFLSPAPDDSHTTMRWDPRRGALTSRDADGIAVEIRLGELTISVMRGGIAADRIPLHGRTVREGEGLVRDALARLGLDPARYSLRRHYDLPHHPVADGAAFDIRDGASLDELSRWFGNAAVALGEVATAQGGSAVTCWPHHFDIATLITIAPGRTTGAGMAPGDGYYDEPYFYVNAYPAPPATALVARLEGNGQWHTHEWIGAVLPGSGLAAELPEQRAQADAFLRSAIASMRKLLDR